MIIDKDNIKILLIILILGLGIGYAYINSDLNINGTAQVNSANWDVHWANVQVDSGSVSASSPTISNQTTVNYSVVLNTPGEYYEFTIDAVNGGSIDAMIDTIDSKLNGATITELPAYLDYTITYSDGTELLQNQELLANTTETYKVRIEYRTDIELNQIPASNQILSLQFTVTYRQATNNSMPVRFYLYRSNYYDVYIGNDVSTIGTHYLTYQDVLSNTGYSTFLRHRIVDNQIIKNDVGFVYNNNVYYLISGGATYNSSTNNYNQDSIYYEQNKAIVRNIFGSSNCVENSPGQYTYYRCESSEYATYITNTGGVQASRSGWVCVVYADGRSYCDD